MKRHKITFYFFGIFSLLIFQESVCASDAKSTDYVTGLDPILARRFSGDFPDKTSLLCLDFSRFPKKYFAPTRGSPSQIYRYLSPSLRKDSKDTYFSDEILSPAPEYKRWLMHKSVNPSGKGKFEYHILRLFDREDSSSLETLLAPTGASIELNRSLHHRATAIIFPVDKKNRALVYGFGKWQAIVNSRAILAGWGLRLAASSRLCNPKKVKVVKATNYAMDTPASFRITSSDLTHIDHLGLEVGSEGLECLSTMPSKSKCFKGTILAVDHFHFAFNSLPSSSLDGGVPELTQMRSFALALESYSSGKKFSIHTKMLPFVDEEETKMSKALEAKLIELIKNDKKAQEKTRARKGLFHIFLSPYVRRMFDGSVYFNVGSGREARIKPSLEDAINEKWESTTFSLDTNLTLNVRGKIFSEQIRFLITSLPFDLPSKDGKGTEGYFRHDRGRWLRVDPSRFEKIKHLLRPAKIDCSVLGLPKYTYEHALTKITTKNGKEVSDGEKAYLRDSMESLGSAASFLDCGNISLGTSKDTFEFGDLLITKDGANYIVHAKRAKANALSHLREQVERSAEYLATNLAKEGSQQYFVGRAVGDFYLQRKMPHTQKDLDAIRKSLPPVIAGDGKSLKDGLLKNSGFRPKVAKRRVWDLKALVLKHPSLSFFDENQEDFKLAFEALMYWVHSKRVDFRIKVNQTFVNDFLDSVKKASELQKKLFAKGALTKPVRKNVVFVLAVIDDRQVEAFKKKEESVRTKAGTIYTKTEPLFRPQDLWGLDMTRTTVQKKGFGFKVLVINEHQTGDWDAFGKIILPDASPPSPTDSDDEDSDADIESLSDADEVCADREEPPVYTFTSGASTLSFSEEKIPGDGDCAFHATGTNREAAINALKEKTGCSYIRELIFADMQALDTTLIGSALPTKKSVDKFLSREFITNKEYMSYVRPASGDEPSGSFVALAKVLKFGLTIFTSDDEKCLTPVCFVPKPIATSPEYFLLHTGYEESTGRHVLNHFNLLVKTIDASGEPSSVSSRSSKKKSQSKRL